MASDPEFTDERFDAQPPAKKPGMSSGMKIIIILLCVGGGSMLLCCGGCFYIGWKFKEGMSDDPQVVAAVSKDIVDMEIPATFQPRASFKMDFPFVPKVSFAIYAAQGERGMLMLMNYVDPNAKPGEFGEAEEKQLQQQMQQQPGHAARNLDVGESKTRSFNIRGQKVAVKFVKGVDPQTKAKFRQVSTTFKGKQENSIVILQLQLAEELYKEDEIDKMLKSIK